MPYVTGLGGRAVTSLIGHASHIPGSIMAGLHLPSTDRQLLVGGVDVWSLAEQASLRIKQQVGREPGELTVSLREPAAGAAAIGAQREVLLMEGGARRFGGILKDRDREHPDNVSAERRHVLRASDFTSLLKANVIASGVRDVAESDRQRIEWVLSHSTKGLTVGPDTATLRNPIIPQRDDYTAWSLEESLQHINLTTGGEQYVDHYKQLHNYAAGENIPAPFGLSDTPDDVTTFAFENLHLPEDAYQLCNAIFIQGDGISGWRTDAASIEAYGRWEDAEKDARITTQAGINERGDAILAERAQPRRSGSVRCWQPGLRKGMTIPITSSGMSPATQTWLITAISEHIEKGRWAYDLSIGDVPLQLAEYVKQKREAPVYEASTLRSVGGRLIINAGGQVVIEGDFDLYRDAELALPTILGNLNVFKILATGTITVVVPYMSTAATVVTLTGIGTFSEVPSALCYVTRDTAAQFPRWAGAYYDFSYGGSVLYAASASGGSPTTPFWGLRYGADASVELITPLPGYAKLTLRGYNSLFNPNVTFYARYYVIREVSQ